MTPQTNADLSPTEAIPDAVHISAAPDHASAGAEACYGCQKTGRQIMVAFQVDSDPRHGGKLTFYDMFLTEEQARKLVVDIERRLAQNAAGLQ